MFLAKLCSAYRPGEESGILRKGILVATLRNKQLSSVRDDLHWKNQHSIEQAFGHKMPEEKRQMEKPGSGIFSLFGLFRVTIRPPGGQTNLTF